MAKDTVLVLGPFPPPAHGFSVATLELAKAISGCGPAQAFSLSTNLKSRTWARMGNAAKCLLAMVRLVQFRIKGGHLVSLGCNGGAGLVFTRAILFCCDRLGLRCNIHHHSYAYINRRSRLMEGISRLDRTRFAHVFLSRRMQEDFEGRYGTVSAAVLPNAYMVAPSEPAASSGRPIVIGLLSNLSRAKGLEHFISLARELKRQGVPFSARLAGPVASRDAALLSRALAEIPELDHAGPLYGQAKSDFLNGLDLFVFPTSYHNEAQPIAIYEAMAQGVPVLTVDRGCIADQVQDCLKVFPDLAAFEREAAGVVARLSGPERFRLTAARAQAQARLAADTRLARAAIEALYGAEARG